ncbi:MAG: TRAP transporter large permease subunit [Pseudomonadales bacterium]|nr:TRAP transporter large permease subunit [Pseudomonadales bacterium]
MMVLVVLMFLLLALLGMPLFTLLSAAALLGFYSNDTPLAVIGTELYRITQTPVLLALPLFTVAGYLLSEGNSSQRLVRVTKALLGWMPAGLAIVSFTACAAFTAFTGASGVTIVALGALLYPALRQSGYPEWFSLGLVTTSGCLGLLLPPSLPLILYSIIVQQMPQGAGVSIEHMFMAGLLPSLVFIILLSLFGLMVIRKQSLPTQPFSWKELGEALWEARFELPLPLVVLGGIYGGLFAVSEAAAVTALYALVVEVVIYRDISWQRLPKLAREAGVMIGGLLLVLACAMAFTNWLIDQEVPGRLFALVRAHVHSRYTFLLLLNIMLLVLGAFLDIFSSLVIMVPLLLPMAVGYGINPVHLGIVFLANMQIGYLMPPIGMDLYIASYRFKRPIIDLVRATWPFMLVLLCGVLILTYVPWLSLGLISGQHH